MHDIDELFAFKKTRYFDGYVLIYYKQKDNEDITALEIPSEYCGEPVCAIADNAFRSSDYIVTVFIPDSVIRIGEWAFNFCENLKYIRLPNKIKSIHDCTFDECSEMEYIDIPGSVRLIGSCAFWHCEKLKKVKLPKDLLNIGGSAFSDCKSLESIVIPPKVKRLGWHSFASCTALKNVELMNPETVITYETFIGCEKLPAELFIESVPPINTHENARRFIDRYDVLELMIERNWHQTGWLDGYVALPRIVCDNRADMLPLAEKAGWLENRDYVRKLSEFASTEKNTECAIWLLNYINRRFGFDMENEYEL